MPSGDVCMRVVCVLYRMIGKIGWVVCKGAVMPRQDRGKQVKIQAFSPEVFAVTSEAWRERRV